MEPSEGRWSALEAADSKGHLPARTPRRGTRFSYDHTGFTGVGGVFIATLLGHVRSKMLNVGLPPVLDDLDEGGTLRPGSTLRTKSLG